MHIREIVLARELDAAWIIALWKAIHGGDGGPEQLPPRPLPPWRSMSALQHKFHFLSMN